MKRPQEIKSTLESAYLAFHSSLERDRDPVRFPRQYKRREDQEIVGFYAALLAYGNVSVILKSVTELLKPMGETPARYILNLSNENPWLGFRHRFTTGEDLFILGHWLRQALRTHGNLENFFMDGANPTTQTMKEMLSGFVQRFSSQDLPKPLPQTRKLRERNLKYLISDPQRGSACKRLNLFLRWMIRPNDGVDLGIWKQIGPEKLMLPIDTHLLKIIRRLRWTRSKTANWRTVEESTQRLAEIHPQDPIRYDFSLCHLSMRGGSL